MDSFVYETEDNAGKTGTLSAKWIPAHLSSTSLISLSLFEMPFMIVVVVLKQPASSPGVNSKSSLAVVVNETPLMEKLSTLDGAPLLLGWFWWIEWTGEVCPLFVDDDDSILAFFNCLLSGKVERTLNVSERDA